MLEHNIEKDGRFIENRDDEARPMGAKSWNEVVMQFFCIKGILVLRYD